MQQEQQPKAKQGATPWVWMPEPDARSVPMPLMQSLMPTATITILYIVVCYLWRARLVAQRKKQPQPPPVTPKAGLLQNIIIGYNWTMVAYSSFITLEIVNLWYNHGVSLSCRKPGAMEEKSFLWSSPQMRVMYVGYAFYISKIIELLDTVFFLMRGKVDQVTFLHVFHHAAMPPSLWWGVHYSPCGVILFFPLINSFIHVLMYTYYGLAAMGAYKYLWWKEYLTMAQMIQFALMIVHQMQVFVPGNKCVDARAFPLAIILYSIIFLFLFGNFYVKAYFKKQRLAKTGVSSQLANGEKKHN